MYAYKPPSFTQKVQQTSKSSRKSSQQRESGLCEAITTCVGSCTTMLPARCSGNRKGKSRISGFTMDQCTLPSPNPWPPGPSFSVIVGAIASRHGKGLNKQQKITIYDVRILAFEVATKGNSSNPYTSDLKLIRYSFTHVSCLAILRKIIYSLYFPFFLSAFPRFCWQFFKKTYPHETVQQKVKPPNIWKVWPSHPHPPHPSVFLSSKVPRSELTSLQASLHWCKMWRHW